MSKGKVSMSCEICRAKNYRIAKSVEERLILKKHCNKCKKHTFHKEEK
ncbi:MAG: 50S ribosomal protein L33 [Mycoplasmatales bacterium]|nr:50S ribosomal protein L33 [Mycoplasmatales bacterium]